MIGANPAGCAGEINLFKSLVPERADHFQSVDYLVYSVNYLRGLAVRAGTSAWGIEVNCPPGPQMRGTWGTHSYLGDKTCATRPAAFGSGNGRRCFPPFARKKRRKGHPAYSIAKCFDFNYNVIIKRYTHTIASFTAWLELPYFPLPRFE